MAIKRKMIDIPIDVSNLSFMIADGSTALELIKELKKLIKEYGDTVEITDGAYSYDLFDLDGKCKRPENDKEFTVRKVRSEKYKESWSDDQ